ncbi:MAG: hypothetical protein H7226_01590 [Salinibacterium sp.]|nr:hypothetical protein [Salinibacterium sp.]
MGSRNTVVVALVSAVLAFGSAVALMGYSPALPGPPQQPRDPHATRLAFYGDSYTLGTGVTGTDLRWSTVICDEQAGVSSLPASTGSGSAATDPALEMATNPAE